MTMYLEEYDVNLGVLHASNEHRNQVTNVRHQHLLADLMLGQ